MNYNKNILKAKLRDALKRISVNVNGKKKTLKNSYDFKMTEDSM